MSRAQAPLRTRDRTSSTHMARYWSAYVRPLAMVSTGVPEVVATPEPVEPTVNEDGTITVQESWWPSADGSHQIHQLTDGTMWNENGQRCDAQGNPIA